MKASLLDIPMVEIPAGTIELRDDRLKHKWTVQLQAFMLAPYPITRDLYSHISEDYPRPISGGKRPIDSVSWRDAAVFCNALSAASSLPPSYSLSNESEDLIFDPQADGYRLPSEAEWEFACKAGSEGIRYGELEQIAWYKENSGGRTHDVGQKEANPWGLHDMIGNVWEWCSDIYDESVYGSYRIFRGGGWCDEARACMATTRRRSHPTSFKIDDLGFRVARNLNVSDKKV